MRVVSMEFSESSYTRFHARMQRSRLYMYTLSFAIVVVLRAAGQVEFDLLGLGATVLVASASAQLFLHLYRRGKERVWGFRFYPIWMGIDLVVISLCVYLTGDPYSLWFMWYLVNAASAAFSEGGRVALIVALADCAAYVTVFLVMTEPSHWAGGLPPILGRLLMLFGLSFLPLRGISELRRRRLVIKGLMAEKTAQVEELTALTATLQANSEALREASLRTQQADRMKSRFLANMSHELRTPLNSIIGFSEVLLGKASDQLDPRFLRFLANIHHSGEHLLSLVNDLLDLSKIEAGRMELTLGPVDLPTLVQGVREIMTSVAEPRAIGIEVELGELSTLELDGPKVKQILYNLVSNALKFSPDGSTVRISAAMVAANQSSLGCEAVRLVVRDEGIGIPVEDLERIFEEFHQVDSGAGRLHVGSGLGLALVQRLSVLQGGRVSVESKVAEGSTFEVLLPARASTVLIHRVESAPGAESPTADATGPTILVVEDEDESFHALEGELVAAGYRPVRARNGEEALVRVREERPAAVTLDIVMPGIDGWEVLTRIKNDPETADVPVLIVSIMANQELAFTLGADDYFTKPIDRKRFLGRLERLARTPADGPPIPILVIDDDPQVHELLAESLPRTQYRMQSAYGGEEGLTMARQTRFGAVVLDLMMPGIDGFEVAETLRTEEATQEVPILVLTAHTLSREERARLEGTINSLLQKGPGHRRRLADTLRRLVTSP